MKWAVLSDIHANLVALETVFQSIEKIGVDRFIYCGDLIVYGPRPNECIEKFDQIIEGNWSGSCIMGNNDLWIIDGLKGRSLNEDAMKSHEWTDKMLSPENRQLLSQGIGLMSDEPDKRQSLVIDEGEQPITVVHGTLDDPLGEYTYLDRNDYTIKEALRALNTPLGFFGHTHRPAIYTGLPKPHPHPFDIQKDYMEEEKDGLYEFSYGEVLEQGKKILVNPGSVGQPRDNDPRAAFMIMDDQEQVFQFYRLPYDIPAVQADMYDQGLPENHINRLLQGR